MDRTTAAPRNTGARTPRWGAVVGCHEHEAEDPGVDRDDRRRGLLHGVGPGTGPVDRADGERRQRRGERLETGKVGRAIGRGVRARRRRRPSARRWPRPVLQQQRPVRSCASRSCAPPAPPGRLHARRAAPPRPSPRECRQRRRSSVGQPSSPSGPVIGPPREPRRRPRRDPVCDLDVRHRPSLIPVALGPERGRPSVRGVPIVSGQHVDRHPPGALGETPRR